MPAPTVSFTPAQEQFLSRPLVAHLATINRSGLPQLTVMWFKYEDGHLFFTTTTDRVKFRNVQRDPRGAVTIVDPDDMYRFVIVEGTFSVDERNPQEFYRGLARHYLGSARLAEWEQTAQMANRTVLLLTPRRARIRGL